MPSLNLRNPLRRDPNRPSLKQRAATLKATAARLIRKPKPLPAAGSPEAAEAFRIACQGVDAASRLSDADMEALCIAPGGSLWTSERVQAALDGKFSRFVGSEIEAARATSRARLRELQILTLRRELHMAEAAQRYRIHEVFALVYGDEPDPVDEDEAPVADGEPDPIFAAIEECEGLEAAEAAAYAKGNDGNPTAEQEAATAALVSYADGPLSEIVPTTAAGCVALTRFILAMFRRWHCTLDRGTAQKLFGLIERSPACASPAPTSSPDRRLVAMVEEWQDVRRKLNDPATLDGPEADALGERHLAQQTEIYLYPARTPRDLLAKVPALRDELEHAKRGADGGQVTNSLPVTAWAGLLADIERIAEATVAQDDDAELIALGRTFDAATVRYQEAHAAADAADERADARKPERPAALFIVGGSAPDSSATRADLRGLRQAAEIKDEPRRSELLARIGEMSEALDVWGAEWGQIIAEEGIDAANAEVEAANAIVTGIARQIAELPARTLPGVWIKVRVAAFCNVCEPTSPHGDRPPGETALLSLYRDTPRLVLDGDGGTSIVPEA